jgi:hypothetical protein
LHAAVDFPRLFPPDLQVVAFILECLLAVLEVLLLAAGEVGFFFVVGEVGFFFVAGHFFFVDFGTNTSIDNIYAVCGVDHKLEPGSFTTSAKLIPVADAYGSYESLFSIIDKLPTAKPTA